MNRVLTFVRGAPRTLRMSGGLVNRLALRNLRALWLSTNPTRWRPTNMNDLTDEEWDEFMAATGHPVNKGGEMPSIANSITLEETEDGFVLVVEDDFSTQRWNVHGIVEQIVVAGQQVADYFNEGARLAREHEIGQAVIEADRAHDEMVGDS